MKQELNKDFIQSELSRLIKNNEDRVPVYIVINSHDPLQAKQPITVCLKTIKFNDFTQQINSKYPQYPLIYIFGKPKSKDIEDISQENKKSPAKAKESKSQSKKERKSKNREYVEPAEIQQFIPMSQSILDMPVGTVHDQYQDSYGLLILALSKTPLIKQKKMKKGQLFLIILAISFGLLFLYLTLAQPSSTGTKIETEIDLIT